MRNLSKLVFQRVVAVSVGILLQIGFLIVMATYLRADFFWIRIAMNVLSWAMVIYIISCGVNPSYKIAWIVLILAFPVAGLTIYLLFGGNKISSYEHRKMQSIEAVTMQQLQQEEEPLWELAAARTPAFNHARYLLSASGYPIYDDADATYFPSGESCYAAMLEELQKAEHYIFIEFFIIAQGKMWDPILQLLREKAAAGVDVRVVYDDFGCITRLPMRYAKKLREMGIRAHAFNPYVPILSARLNNRDHRKLMIIGDHVLERITPSVSSWFPAYNALEEFLESLGKMYSYDVDLVLPAHGTPYTGLRERVMFLIAHHGERLQELYDLVAAGHDDIVSISSHAKWRYENWNEWPLDQKFFSMGETMAHLVHLVCEGKIKQTICGDEYRFELP